MMQAYKLRLIDVKGRVWNLNDCRSPVRVRHGGWPTLTARATQHTVGLAGGGRRVVPGRGRITDGSGALTVGFYPEVGRDLREVRRRWIDGWAFDEPCQLQVVGAEREGKYTALVRLDEGREIDQPQTLNFATFFELAMPIVWDKSGWVSKRTRPGPDATITNNGMANAVVSIEWGSGGTVTMPSGATFTLPYTADRRIITLDRGLSFPVTDLNGTPDKAMQRRLWGRALDEQVKPGQTKTFKGPTGCVFRYELREIEPWR